MESGVHKLHPNGIALCVDPLQSRYGIAVMYHGQMMLTPVLTVEQKDLVTRTKHETTHGRRNKETGNDHQLPVPRILWNCQEGSREFYTPVMDIKPGPMEECKE